MPWKKKPSARRQTSCGDHSA